MISAFLIIGTIAFLYKPTYSVFMNGEPVGYTENKAELQHRINAYIENGEEGSNNTAFVQVTDLPSYELCLLKKNIVTNDEEILEKINAERMGSGLSIGSIGGTKKMLTAYILEDIQIGSLTLYQFPVITLHPPRI